MFLVTFLDTELLSAVVRKSKQINKMVLFVKKSCEICDVCKALAIEPFNTVGGVLWRKLVVRFQPIQEDGRRQKASIGTRKTALPKMHPLHPLHP